MSDTPIDRELRHWQPGDLFFSEKQFTIRPAGVLLRRSAASEERFGEFAFSSRTCPDEGRQLELVVRSESWRAVTRVARRSPKRAVGSIDVDGTTHAFEWTSGFALTRRFVWSTVEPGWIEAPTGPLKVVFDRGRSTSLRIERGDSCVAWIVPRSQQRSDMSVLRSVVSRRLPLGAMTWASDRLCRPALEGTFDDPILEAIAVVVALHCQCFVFPKDRGSGG